MKILLKFSLFFVLALSAVGCDEGLGCQAFRKVFGAQCFNEGI